MDSTIKATTTSTSASKKISVKYTDGYIDFLAKHVVYAPSGARTTVMKANSLTEQAINFAVKAKGPDDESLAQPRQITLDFDPKSEKVQIKVTPLKRVGKQTVAGESFNLPIDFDEDSTAFLQPNGLAVDPPSLKTTEAQRKEKPLTKREIFEARFPKNQDQVAGIANKIDETLIGQGYSTKIVETDLNSFLGRPGPVKKNPPFRIIAGFPGIGKSELANLAGKYADLPIVRLNMQAYSGTDAAASTNFLWDLSDGIDAAKAKSKNGKFILLIEELDKTFEINPQSGAFVDRPVMNYIKDLINDGFVRTTIVSSMGKTPMFIDARNAYNMVTMNFAVDRFGFVADPRLTTIEDVLSAWKRLKTRPADLKGVLGSMFLPETVSRMLPRFLIMQPLEKKDYETIIQNQVDSVIQGRLYDPVTGKNKGQIDVQLTPEYRRYLYKESVIPSEGARNTVVGSQQRISTDLEDALKGIPKSSDLATKPLVITLDYKPGKSAVVATAVPKGASGTTQPRVIFDRNVELTFPPLTAFGKMPEERILTSVHEFGHAFTGVRLGKRIEYATVVPPRTGVGGYVKFRSSSQSARELLSDIYSTLGARAMERVFLSDKPLEAKSVLDITAGASNDILQATKGLWNLIYEYGFDPGGGPIERRGFDGPARYANFSDISAEDVQKLQTILRKMEDHVVEDLLSAHPKDWYVDKISKFARKGGVDEKGFYDILGYPAPGMTAESVAPNNRLREAFKGIVAESPKDIQASRNFKQGLTQTTASENLESAVQLFEKLTREELHSKPSAHLPTQNAADFAQCAAAALENRIQEAAKRE